MDESTLAVLDGRKSAGLGHGGVAELETVRWRTLAVLDGRDSASWVYGGVAGRETAE